MVTTTTTYSLKKPTVGDDEDVWGGYLNDSMDLIDDVLDGTTPVTGIDINSGTLDNVTINSSAIGGTTAAAGTFTTLSATTSLGVTGNITVSGTVDGRDVAADGTKLDGIESGATADQTKADIDALGIAASTAATLATARNIALTGAVTGNVNFDGSGNVSIATTATSDPTLTLSGDVTGSATFTNLGNATLTTTIADDSHNHIIGNVDGLQTALDAKLASSSYTASDVLTKIKTVDGSGSGLDADLWDGNQFSSYLNQAVLTSSSPTFSNAYIAGSVYHSGDTDTRMVFDTNAITLQTGGSSEITVTTTGVRLGDSGNGYFQPVTGDYGSVQIDGGAHGGYEGYSIGGRVVFMHENNTAAGIFNDVDNQWMFLGTLGGSTKMHHAGGAKIQTTSDGAQTLGKHYVDASLAEDWDSLSGTSVTCNLSNAAAFSLTMTGNTTFTFSGANSGWSQGFVLQLTGNGSTVTWPSSVDWAGGTAPDAPASGETDIYVFWTRNGGTTWYGVQSIDAAA